MIAAFLTDVDAARRKFVAKKVEPMARRWRRVAKAGFMTEFHTLLDTILLSDVK